MNHIIIILLVTSFNAYSQREYVNQEVKKTAQEQLGKKIGYGSCQNFVDFVLIKSGAVYKRKITVKHPFILRINFIKKLYAKVIENKITSFGEKIKAKDAKEGDIYTFDNVRLSFSRGKWNHVGIILENKGEGHYDTIEQNVNGSNVVYHKLDLSEIISGKVTFYRPYKTRL
tara:strand:- start:1034 stop:1549 length:516 start_codon:yes stop_codon:yes gene_type:complete